MALTHRVDACAMPGHRKGRQSATLPSLPVITRLRPKVGSDAIRCLAFASLLVVILAGCTASPSANLPSTTNSTGPITHSQVLGWVTPTLANGVSFVASLSSSSTTEQMFADSRPLSTAVSVSLHELAEVPWNGAFQGKERELVEALERIKNLTAAAPGPGYLDRLDHDVVAAQGSLRALHRAVDG